MTTVIVNNKKYNLHDMQRWYVQIRGFPSILVFGRGKNKVMGEGQSGGRYVSSIAREAERKFVDKFGLPEYQKKIDKIMIEKGDK